jgi:hypothetical protein
LVGRITVELIAGRFYEAKAALKLGVFPAVIKHKTHPTRIDVRAEARRAKRVESSVPNLSRIIGVCDTTIAQYNGLGAIRTRIVTPIPIIFGDVDTYPVA